MNQKLDEERKLSRHDQFIDDAAEYKDDYEEGDVTGFMVEKPLPNNGMNSFDVSSNSIFRRLLRAQVERKIISLQF